MRQKKFQCPACGFQILNRRVAKCESCDSALPEELLYTAEEIAILDAQHQRSRKAREEQGQKEKGGYDFSVPFGADGLGDFDIGGDGGESD